MPRTRYRPEKVHKSCVRKSSLFKGAHGRSRRQGSKQPLCAWVTRGDWIMETGLIKLLLIWQHRRALTRRDWRRKELFCFVCVRPSFGGERNRVDFRPFRVSTCCGEAAPSSARVADSRRKTKTRKTCVRAFHGDFPLFGRGGWQFGGEEATWNLHLSAFRLSSETERCIIPAHPKQANFPDCLNSERGKKEKQKFFLAEHEATAAEK